MIADYPDSPYTVGKAPDAEDLPPEQLSTHQQHLKRDEREAWKKHRKELLAQIEQYDLEFTYMRPTSGWPHRIHATGGATVCWRMPSNKGTNMLEVSIAWCHDKEQFDKLKGRWYAASEFLAGRTVLFKLPCGEDSISRKLKGIFGKAFFDCDLD